jgi:hypothetical protein
MLSGSEAICPAPAKGEPKSMRTSVGRAGSPLRAAAFREALIYAQPEQLAPFRPPDQPAVAGSASWIATANPVEALLDRGETRLDRRLELRIGEDIRPIAFDALANKFTDVKWIDTLRDAFAEHLDSLRRWRRGHRRNGRAIEPLRHVALRIQDLGADESGTQHRYADPAGP